MRYEALTSMNPSSSYGKGEHQAKKFCTFPSQCVRVFRGHNGPVSAIRFFPKSGHLLLSCGFADATLRLWDVQSCSSNSNNNHNNNSQRSCVETFRISSSASDPHSFSNSSKNSSSSSSSSPQSLLTQRGGIRDAQFLLSGERIVSVSCDRCLRLWDTVTGVCLCRFELSSEPLCVSASPLYPHSVLCGLSSNRVQQFDLRSKHAAQTYADHLKPVRAIIFGKGAHRFFSASDDNSIRVWEYNTPIPIFRYQDSGVKPISAWAIHPSRMILLLIYLFIYLFINIYIYLYR